MEMPQFFRKHNWIVIKFPEAWTFARTNFFSPNCQIGLSTSHDQLKSIGFIKKRTRNRSFQTLAGHQNYWHFTTKVFVLIRGNWWDYHNFCDSGYSIDLKDIHFRPKHDTAFAETTIFFIYIASWFLNRARIYLMH